MLLGFPSPCGEKVGINMAVCDDYNRIHYMMFPSPCGEKVGINLKLVKTEGECYSGFRPLAGKR